MGDEIVRIELNHGAVALIDAEDADLVAPYNWCCVRQSGLSYANGRIGRGPTVKMHRIVMGFGEGDPNVDHWDRDGLNNTKSNLRPCTQSQNMANRTASANPNMWSRFKGVYYHPRSRRWIARICVRAHKIAAGHFRTEDEAARAYDKAAIHYFGRFARTNLEMGLFDLEPTVSQLRAVAVGVRLGA